MGKTVDYEKMAQEILSAVGGQANVSSVTHCMTRLRFNLKDESLPSTDEIGKISGVMGTMKAGGQLQVVIGQTVDKVYNELCTLGGFDKTGDFSKKSLPEKKAFRFKSLGASILDALAGCFTPLIPLLLTAALFKTLATVLGPSMLGLLPEASDMLVLFTFVGDAGFYFMPIVIGYTAAKKFGVTPVLGMFMGAILLHPTLIQMAADGKSFSVFGIPATAINYTSTTIPVVLSVWVMSYIERFFKAYLPATLKTLFSPFLTSVIMLPIALVVVGPAGAFIGSYISNGLLGLSGMGAGILAIGLIGAFWQLLVLSGMHMVMITTLIVVFTTNGSESVVAPAAAAATFAVHGMSLGAALRLKNKEERGLSIGYLIAGLIGGVTEPAMYGIAIRYKRPFIGMLVGGFVGGIYGGIMGVTAYNLVPVASFLALLGFAGGPTANMVQGVITCGVAFVVAAIVTYVVGFDTKKSKDSVESISQVS